MAEFLTNLWTSVFTPGPTPTLIHATNISFLALQSILFVLLLATYSIHFIILSFLSAGLWAGINWFVRELEASTQREKEKQIELDGKANKGSGEGEGSEGDNEEGSHGSGTETEEAPRGALRPQNAVTRETATGTGASGAGGLTLNKQETDLRKRRSFGEGSSTGDMSTDSEWDKLDEAADINK